MFNDITWRRDGLEIVARREALISITSDRLPKCHFWYDEGLTSQELCDLIDKKFGADSEEAADACNAPLVITYDDGDVEYVMDAHTSTTTAAWIGYTIGRYCAAHNVPHSSVALLLVQMPHQLEQEGRYPRSK